MDEMKLHAAKSSLEKNGFAVTVAESVEAARRAILEEILPGIAFRSVSYADSTTLRKTGVLDVLRNMESIRFIETFDKAKDWETLMEARRQALLVDLFLTGTNAVTEDGKIINLDMIGNRISGITFGPKQVILVVGWNKIVPDIEAASRRIKETSAPANASRHPVFSLPCARTGRCVDCGNETRICNYWSILERCYPKKRITIVLIKDDLGL